MIGADEAAYITLKLLGNKLISPELVKSQIESVIVLRYTCSDGIS
jgi:hypothetical protein